MRKISVVMLIFVLCGCLIGTGCAEPGRENEIHWDGTPTSPPESAAVPPEDAEENRREISADFAVSSDSGSGFSLDGDTVTVTAGGTYTFTGKGQGRIVVRAGDSDKVKLVFAGCSLSNAEHAPVSAESADKVTVCAAEGTFNEILDLREKKPENAEASAEENGETEGGGAVWAACDLELSGKGSLLVEAGFNNGIHTKDDLTVKNLTLKVTAVHNALKGSDGVRVESGNLILTAENGDGIKTKNSGLSAKGSQKGTVSLLGGNLEIRAKGDGIQAAYNISMENDCVLHVVTQKSADSCKGLKAGNAVLISGGTLTAETADDAIHADGGELLENGEEPLGEVRISGGVLTLTAGDDGIHGDNLLTVTGGYIDILQSVEGLEAVQIGIQGGTVLVKASDDGINACGGSGMGGFPGRPGGDSHGGFPGDGGRGGSGRSDPGYPGGDGGMRGPGGFPGGNGGGGGPQGNPPGGPESEPGSQEEQDTVRPCVTVSGGFVTVETSAGDTDGIDSNGDYVQTGGFVLVKGGSSSGGVSGSVDVDGTVTVTGGTIVALGGICELPGNGSQNGMRAQRKQLARGNYRIVGGDGELAAEFTLEKNYSSLWICSAAFQKGKTYYLEKDDERVLSWKQTEGMTSVS